jgi:hypothetical protein
MLAAASCVFGGRQTRLVETPAPDGLRRASTYDTLKFLADDLSIDAAAPLGLVTSPTCRPFQYLEAVRALGLEHELPFELVAHPPTWPTSPGSSPAAPQVYLQEIRSAIQAAGRLADALSDAAAAATDVRPVALA